MSSDAEMRTIEFGPYRINKAERLLQCNGKVVHLYPKAIDILLVLLDNEGRLMKKNDLIRAAWGNVAIDDNALMQCVSQLRKAFGDDKANPKYIKTVYTSGYLWVASVREPGNGILPAAKADLSPKQRSVVVFGLENLTPNAGLNYLAAGMTEAVLASLGKIEGLTVIAYADAKPGHSTAGPAPTAHSMGADFALTGSVLFDGLRVRFTEHLLEAHSGQQIWAETYDAAVSDVLETFDTVSKKIAEEIRVKLTPQDQVRLASSRKVNPAAYLEYLHGRYFWNRRTPEAFRKAMGYFQKAIEVDPTWAPPYAGLADAYSLLGSTSYDALTPREAMPKAKAAAASALQMDPSNAAAHASMAYFLLSYEWDFAAAEREFKRALELNPGYATAHHWYAHYLLATGKTEDGISEMRTAWERDPLSLAINTGLGWSLYMGRRYDEAIEQYRKTLEMDENFVIARCLLGMAYERKEIKAEAIAEFQRVLTASPGNLFALARLGQTYAGSGNSQEALRIVEQLTQLSKSRYVPSTYAGGIYAALGDYDQAFAWANKANDERSHYLIYVNIEPSLDGFRADPRFPELARRIGLIK